MFSQKVTSKYVVRGAPDVLKWSDDYDGDDLGDALDHVNLMRSRQMEHSISAVEEIDVKVTEPQKLLPTLAFKGKPFGWLKAEPKASWVALMKDVYKRDVSHILEKEEINPPIAIEGELGDGFARVLLAYSLGEKLPVVYFEEETDS